MHLRRMTNLCSGNNSGSLSYVVLGVLHILNFTPGHIYGFPVNTLPVSLRISSFKGSATRIS
jgi:hypothetical protein